PVGIKPRRARSEAPYHPYWVQGFKARKFDLEKSFQKDGCGKIRDRRDGGPTVSLGPGSRLPFWLAGLFLSLAHPLAADITTITVHADKPGAKIKPAMWGIFFEDIN